MRFLITGLLLMALGIGFAEYTRRHRAPAATGSGASSAKAPAVPATAAAVLTSEAPRDVTPAELAPLTALLEGPVLEAPPAGKLVPALTARWVVRALAAGPGFVVASVEGKGVRGLARLAPGEAPRALAAARGPVTALCVDGARVTWAEDGVVWQHDGAAVKPLVRFPKGAIFGLAHRGAVLLAAVQPRDADPFASDPNGAVVRIGADGKVTPVATEQVRPRDLLTDGQEAFWVGGYPAGLVRAALDGSFSARISERADGPLVFDDAGLVFRFPLQSGSEVRRLGKAGGNARTLTTSDTDLVAAQGGRALYTTSGMLPHLLEREGEAAQVDLLAIKGTVKALAASADLVVLATMQEDGATQLHWRVGPPAP